MLRLRIRTHTRARHRQEGAIMNDFPGTEELEGLDACWRAANYLTVGQIYLQSNPVLATPLKLADIKPRLLGHSGTSPGLNLIYTDLNRLIRHYDLNMLFVTGPGHGGPAMVAQAYLDGTYTELNPAIERNAQKAVPDRAWRRHA